MDLYSDGGCAFDLSLAVMERSMLHAENAYFIPDIAIRGTVCRTNLPSNTAFRGFGGPQGIAAIECVIEEVATRLGLDPLDVRRRNLYGGPGRDVTPYGQVLPGVNTLPGGGRRPGRVVRLSPPPRGRGRLQRLVDGLT